MTCNGVKYCRSADEIRREMDLVTEELGQPAGRMEKAAAVNCPASERKHTNRPIAMPIMLHAILRGFVSVICFFAGGILGATTYSLALMFLDFIGIDCRSSFVAGAMMIVAAILFFGGAILGLKLGAELVAQFVPARCRLCRGRAYPYQGKEVGAQLAYRCRSCDQIHRLPIYSKGGRF